MHQILRKITPYFGVLNKGVIAFGSVIFVLLIGYLDYLSGFQLSCSLFYLLPISIVAWFVGRNAGLVASVLSALIWYLANVLVRGDYAQAWIVIWNTLIRLGFFTIVTLLLADLKQSMKRERNLSHTDDLTGAINSRYFYELASMELLRAMRYNHPLTLAYMDVDNFKDINDRLGHAVGDRLLHAVAESLQATLRRTDVVARVGGDEFVLLLPETGGAAAKAAITRVHSSLCDTMLENNWEVTFSIGVVTYNKFYLQPDEVLREVYELMEQVKESGKNDIRFSEFG
jgi:diguanylate cyclase (GGDEF)-like protein